MKKEDNHDRIMFRDAPPKNFGYARDNRKQETLAEKALWEQVLVQILAACAEK